MAPELDVSLGLNRVIVGSLMFQFGLKHNHGHESEVLPGLDLFGFSDAGCRRALANSFAPIVPGFSDAKYTTVRSISSGLISSSSVSGCFPDPIAIRSLPIAPGV